MVKRVAFFSATLCLLFSFGSVLADDYTPPPWERGSDGTTYQRWEFDADTNPTGPDAWDYVPGDYEPALTPPTLTVLGLETHKPIDYDKSGVWKFEDKITIEIANFNNDNPSKEIWLQLTYSASGPPDVYVDAGGARFFGTQILEEASGDYYVYAIWQIIIEPNPASEILFIAPRDCTAYVDEIVIDTICIPEPATVLMLALGGLALLRKRKV